MAKVYSIDTISIRFTNEISGIEIAVEHAASMEFHCNVVDRDAGAHITPELCKVDGTYRSSKFKSCHDLPNGLPLSWRTRAAQAQCTGAKTPRHLGTTSTDADARY